MVVSEEGMKDSCLSIKESIMIVFSRGRDSWMRVGGQDGEVDATIMGQVGSRTSVVGFFPFTTLEVGALGSCRG